jgi:uncharacterized protein (TIGR03435 family)
MIARLSIAAVLVTLVCPAAMAETPTPAAPSVAHPAALAQQRTDTLAAPFAFDVASIKPSDPNARAGGGGFDATGYRITNYPLWLIIRSAYFSLISHGTQLIGLPAWADKEHYDVLAHIDEASASAWVKLGPLQRQQPGRLMLQQLLADRCKLVAHTVPTQVDGYILVVGKGGSRLTPSKPGATYPADARDFFNTSVQQLAEQLGWAWDIHDQTDLTGRYDFTIRRLELPVDSDGKRIPDPQPNDLWDISATGLEIKHAKVPSENLVIDHLERPSPN